MRLIGSTGGREIDREYRGRSLGCTGVLGGREGEV